MFGLGFSEILVIGVLALILLGPEQLPDLARTIGRFVNDLRRTTDGLKEEFRQASIHPSNLLEEIKQETEKAGELMPPTEIIHHDSSDGHHAHHNPVSNDTNTQNPFPTPAATDHSNSDKKVTEEDGNG